MVDDGQILVLGGLIEDRYTDNKSKVPFLGDIPYLGSLFRTETRDRKRTNLMVFLRPTVLRDAETSNKLSVDRYDLIRSFQQDQQPRPNLLVPVNEAPVVPPLPRLEDSVVPISAPQTSPGTARPNTPPASPPPQTPNPAPTAPAPPASAPGG
jgi:general secretion pathway protein D